MALRFLIEATCRMRLRGTRVRLITRLRLIGRLKARLRLKVRRGRKLRRNPVR